MNDGPIRITGISLIDVEDIFKRANEMASKVMREVVNGEYIEYDEYLIENENEQAFLDAGHFYGL
ncbi:MAG: hypothetical protein J6S67_12285 [Methanobrevibacter sp.]|nr:hypothetical protein [Methanobrevibacter sp.]